MSTPSSRRRPQHCVVLLLAAATAATAAAAVDSGDGSSSCIAVLEASCSTHAAKAHSLIDSENCSLCAGKEQHALRIAGCTAAEVQAYCRSLPSGAPFAISDAAFRPSPSPFNVDFFGTTPYPDKSGLACGMDTWAGEFCFINVTDRWLAETLPVWQPAAGAISTRPWTNGFSAPRLLGGIADHNASTNTYTPNLDFEIVSRGSDGKLAYNFSRIDVTIDGWLHAAKTEHFLLVLDNIPYCFVAPENRYYLGFGMGAAPDDPQEFAAFVGVLATHLVQRYSLELVSKWRFRLGTECDGPRIGHAWLNFTAPNPPFVMADGKGGNYTSRVNGLDKYVETYLAVAKELKRVVPKAAFGPSNMAGVSGDVDAGAGGGGGTEICTSCTYLNEFADRIKAAGAPLDFIAASEYSKWDAYGLAESQPMAGTIRVLQKLAERATGVTTTPVEVHEFGWAGWGHWAADFGHVSGGTHPMGSYGGAWDLGAYLYQRVGGASRVFHWGEGLDSTLNRGVRGRGGNASNTCLPGTTWKEDCRLRGYPLVSAHGWLLSALLHVAPEGVQSSEFVADIPVPIAHPTPHKPKSYNHSVGAVKSFADGRLTYLILNFSPNSTEHTKRRFRLEVSAHDVAAVLDHSTNTSSGSTMEGALCAGLAVSQQAHNRTTAVHDLIEDKLFQSQMKVEAEMRSVDNIGKMATEEGLHMLSASAALWMELNRQSLRFTDYDGAIRAGEGGGCVLEFELETPSMLLLQLNKATHEQAPGQTLKLGAGDFDAASKLEPFWSTQPLGAHITPPSSSLATQNNSALECAAPPLGRCMFGSDDEWLASVLPMWPKSGRKLTLPFTRNLSAVRMLGGLTHNWPHTGVVEQRYVPLPEWDLCYRDAGGAIVHNWTRMDTTLDAFVAAGITPSPVVLDNIPYAFVAEENRFYGGFGLGSAPDNVTEFGVFIEAMVRHLVGRYGHTEVSRWRFRLGTESNGPRMGPRWTGVSGNDPVPMPTADGTMKNFSNGLDQYLDTYAAAAAAVKRVVPEAGFGPCNFAGLGAPEGPTEQVVVGLSPAAAAATVSIGTIQLDQFAKAVHARQLPIDFFAMSEYSRDTPGPKGSRQVAPQGSGEGVARLGQLARVATTGSAGAPGVVGATIPIEVHEYGWAAWVGSEDQSAWPHGSFGAAYNVASWLWQRRAGVAKVFHWGYKFDDSLAAHDPAPRPANHTGRPLLSGWGWPLAAMELLIGRDDDAIAAQMVVDTPSALNPLYNSTFGAIRSAQPKARSLQYLLCAFSGNYTEHSVLDLTLAISAEDFPGAEPYWDLKQVDAVWVTAREFTASTSVHDVIQRDLQAAGGYPTLLTKADPSVDMVRKMATKKGLEVAAKSVEKYLAMSNASLNAHAFAGELSVSGGTLEARLRMERPSLVLLTFTANTSFM